LFFLGALRHKLLPLARACQKIGHAVNMVIPDHLEPLIEATDIAMTLINTEALSRDIHLRGELDFHIYQSGNNSELAQNAGKFFRDAVNDIPDLIVLWENTSTHLQIAFPEAKILHLMPGFLGRLPYPELVYFDTRGLFKNSRLYQEVDSILAGNADARSFSLASEIKRLCVPFFEGMDKIADSVDNLVAGRNLVNLSLMPLQFSRHYNFRSDTPYQSQSEFLLDILAKTPSDRGVLVTQYVAGGITDAFLNEPFLSSVCSRYGNLLYDSTFDGLDNISQFILPFTDSVITCSSSLGLQGLLYDKKVQVVQDTFLSKVVERAQQNDGNRKKVLAHLLGQSCVQWKRLLEPKFLTGFLDAVVDDDISRPYFDLHAIDSDYGSKLLADFRFSRTLQKSGHFLRTQKKGHDYISPSVLATLKEAKLVSFDIFDTLIERPLTQPSDLFLALERRWKINNPARYLELSRARVEAEAMAKAALPEGEEEVNLAQIYVSLSMLLGLSDEESRDIMALELELEEKLLTSRPIGKKLYELAKSLGKKVIYASDMYLPAEFIRSALKKNGFDSDDTLYLSCDLGLKKKTGTLFSYILAEEGVESSAIVHFGDNPQGDDAVPKSYGIKAYRLPRAIDRMRGHERYKTRFKLGGRGNRSLHESAIAFLTARQLFDNPFSPPNPNTYFNYSAINLGYCGFGPCVTDFALWLGERVDVNGNDGVFFVARDGRVVMDAYLALFPERKDASAYIFGSRLLLRTSFAPSAAELYAALGDLKSKRPSDLLRRWYGWETDNEMLQQTVTDEDSLTAARHALSLELPKLGERNSANAALLRDYAMQVGLLQAKKPAIVEIGYAGTIQEGFYKALDISTRGYYFTLFDSAHARISDDLPMEGYVGHLVDRMHHWHGISQSGFLYETLFCSEESTILGLRKIGDAVCAVRENNDYDAARRSFIRKVHRGAVQYAADLSHLLSPILDLLTPEASLGAKVLDDFVHAPAGRDAALLEGVIFSNNFDDGSYRYVVPPRNLIGEVKSGLIKTIWPRGTAAFHAELQCETVATKNIKQATASKSKVVKPKLEPKQVQETSSPNREISKHIAVNPEQVAKTLEHQFQQSGKPNLLRQAAEQYVKAGKKEQAIMLLMDARKLLPKNKSLKNRLLVLRHPSLRMLLGENEFLG